MCAKGLFQKFYIINLKIITATVIGLFNIEELYQSCNFGCFWSILFTVKPICCAFQNLCMAFRNILCFLLHFDQRNIFFKIADIMNL